jgi:tetraacyldisaccharide 4'-kinase
MSWLLWPVSAVYGAVAARRMARPGVRAGVPVVCVGNYHLGGAGKTPVTLALAQMLRAMGERPVVVSRGYGGSLEGPVDVDARRHMAAEVGDEPLMMAERVPVVVARDRAAGAMLARERGASVVLLDDGLQNPALVKDVTLAVVDGTRALGNGHVFPAGPLRAPLPPQLACTDVLIVVGAGRSADELTRTVAARGGLVLRANFVADPQAVERLQGRRVLAFAGIGDPQRFFATLCANDIDVAETKAFADHHAYAPYEITDLRARATAQNLTLVTTEKDMARIASEPRLSRHRAEVLPFKVTLQIENESALRSLLTDRLAAARHSD